MTFLSGLTKLDRLMRPMITRESLSPAQCMACCETHFAVADAAYCMHLDSGVPIY